MVVLVTGAEGQLGRCIADIFKVFDAENIYYFMSRDNFDLRNENMIFEQFERFKPDVVVNCAAYTKVENAEQDYWDAYAVNVEGVQNLVKACKEFGSSIIHISTDYVFDGRKKTTYLEEDKMHPLNTYGITKMLGEVYPLEYNKGIVIRTSWLYSEYGHNFYRTMIERIREQKETNVVNDQIGTPTYAKDLALFIVRDLIASNKYKEVRGIYNFSNNGIASWYDFASMIETLYNNFGPYEPIRKDQIEIKFVVSPYAKKYIRPTTTKKYKSKAKRPMYSVLEKTKVETEFGIKIPHWTESLLKCMKNDGKIIKG